MPERVANRNEVSINAIRYRTKGPVAQSYTSRFAPKFLIGDINKDSQEDVSIWSPRFIKGIGKRKIRPGEESSRAWWSTLDIRYDGHLVLPQLPTTTAASGVSGSFTIGAIGELANEVYAAFGTDVRKYNNVTDSWGSSLATLPAVATDSITFRMNNTVYLAFATTGGYTYTSDGTAWTDDTRDTLYFAYWDDRLWGIDNTGLLWWSSTIGAESDDAQLPLPNGSTTNLFVARNAADVAVIYAMTTSGLWVHNNDKQLWMQTEFQLPYHPDNGKGAIPWRDAVYISSGAGVYRYIQGGDHATVVAMGPDRDDGLPSSQRGVIRQLAGSHNDLLAITDSTSAPATVNLYDGSAMGSHITAVIPPNVGFSVILGWNEVGWDCKWLSADAQEPISSALVSNAYSTYRLWWGQNGRIYYMPLQRDLANPQEVTTLTYASTTEELITPWLEVGTDVDGLALSLKVETRNATSTETVTAGYGTNYGTTFTNFTAITSNGTTEFLFPDSTTPSGTAFRAIRFRVRLVRGTTNTNTPDVLSLTFLYRKKLPAKYRFSVELDISKEYAGLTPDQMRDSLRTALESNTLMEFTYRNDTGTDFGASDRRFFVDLVEATNLEETGQTETGSSLVTMVER